MKQQSPLLRIWELGEKEHGRLIGAIVLAAVGVIGGMVPYFAAAKMVALLMSGERDLSVYLIWGGVAMAGYAAKTLLYTFALSLSHAATFAVLKEIRQKILEKLPRLPLGTVIDTSSGKLKQIIVDQVDGMETTRAFTPSAVSLSHAATASSTSEPVAMKISSGWPAQSFST